VEWNKIVKGRIKMESTRKNKGRMVSMRRSRTMFTMNKKTNT
jgi:hypothetical protein